MSETKRNLHEDLALCEKATAGRWEYIEMDNVVISNYDDYFYAPEIAEEIGHEYDGKFIAEARDGWPHAIERAIEAEAELAQGSRVLYEAQTEIDGLKAEVERLQAELDETMQAIVDGRVEVLSDD